jgi:hypothetical protein
MALGAFERVVWGTWVVTVEFGDQGAFERVVWGTWVVTVVFGNQVS